MRKTRKPKGFFANLKAAGKSLKAAGSIAINAAMEQSKSLPVVVAKEANVVVESTKQLASDLSTIAYSAGLAAVITTQRIRQKRSGFSHIPASPTGE
jgi:hypothetical protein